jgi:N-acylneuraminate cytidylyltransferase
VNLAVIPARGGSKRIPRKNIKPFCGKPIIAWSIEAAKASGCFERIIVSTDDNEIAEVANQWGADVPFNRPAELADDHTGTTEVIAHAIRQEQLSGRDPQNVCCLYATAPFLDPGNLRQGLEMLKQENCEYVFSVTSYACAIQRAIRITKAGRIEMFQSDNFNTRSQDLEHAFHDAGQFYWGKASAWLAGSTIFGPGAAPIRIPRSRVQDIDTQEDWERAEYMFEALRMRKDRS